MTVEDFRKKQQQQRIANEMRERGASEGYISRILSVARAALRRAYDNEEIAVIPPFIKLARGEPRDRVLSQQEAAALFSPVIPMVETLRPWLQSAPDGPLIHHKRGRYTKLGWDAIFKRLVKRASVVGVPAYTIRHTIATEMAQRGVPELEIEMFMGHNLASRNITGHYLHVRPEYLKSAVKAVDEYFAELAPLVNRPILRVELEEQPLPSEWLRAHCVPNTEGTTDAFEDNVLNQLVGVKGFGMFLRSRYEFVLDEPTRAETIESPFRPASRRVSAG